MVGKEYKVKKKKPTKKSWKILGYGWILVGMLAVITILLERYGEWRQHNDLDWRFPIEVITHKIVTVVPVKPIIIAPWVEEVEGIQVDSPTEQKILEIWGERYFLVATAIFKCESGLRAEAVNWKSGDVGVAQINWPTWETKVKEQFGYTIKDMFDEDRNLEVAYWIWDRADGTEGDGKGSFEPWVAYTSGSFRGCID